MEPTAPADAPKPNPVGAAALVAGMILMLVSIAVTALSQVLPWIIQQYDLTFSQVAWVLSVPSGIVALITTVLGVIGLILPGRRRTAAIIGTTLGAAHLVQGLAGLLSGMAAGLIIG